MTVIALVNPKGGVGKSTLSTQLAGYLAAQGQPVVLGDVDRQQSARTWLSLRPALAKPIGAWSLDISDPERPPKGSHAVLDTPAGLHGKALDAVLKLSDRVLVPLQPSIFDIHATYDFLRLLAEHRRAGKVQIGVIGMRTRDNQIGTDQLREFLAGNDLPVIGFLRDTQHYVQLAAHGLTLWDVPGPRYERDLAEWAPLLRWLGV